MIASFAQWASNLPLSLTIQTTKWAIPSLQTVHILAIAGVMAAAFMINLRVLGVAAVAQPTGDVARRFLPWIWVGTLVLALSGVPLGMSEALDVIPNPAFQTKMLLLVCAIGITWLNGRRVIKASKAGNMPNDLTTKGTALVSLLLWVMVVIAGRWIGYTG